MSTKGSKRALKAPRVKWSEEMVSSVLEAIKNSIGEGRKFEKPTAAEYYRRILSTLDPELFEGVTWDKLQQQMRNQKSTYQAALQWRNQTGQGILESDPDGGGVTVKEAITKRCPHFERLDEILGEKPQFNPPFVHDSSTATNTVLEIDPTDHSTGIDVETRSALDTARDGTQQADEWEEFEVIGNPLPLDKTTRKRRASEDISPISRKASKDPIKSTVAALEEAMSIRSQTEQLKLEAETKRFERERLDKLEQQTTSLALDREKLDFEKTKWQQEYELKAKDQEKAAELQRLKIEKEAELAKLKLQQEFELEKLKLQCQLGLK